MYSRKDLIMPDLDIDLRLPLSFPMLEPRQKRVSVKKTDRFYKNKPKIRRAIFDVMDDHEIIYGARALNKRFPHYLDRPTNDYDIFTPHPHRDAREAERKLDKAFGGDFFSVEKAQCPRTWRVRSNVDGEVYVDYTRPEEHIPFDVIGGRKYVKLGYVKKTIRRTLADPEASYRYSRDQDALNRIKIYEKLRRKRR